MKNQASKMMRSSDFTQQSFQTPSSSSALTLFQTSSFCFEANTLKLVIIETAWRQKGVEVETKGVLAVHGMLYPTALVNL